MARHYSSKGMHKDPRERSRFHSSAQEAIADNQYAHMEGARNTDDHMIHEDHRAVANLPQEVMIKPYPVEREFMESHLNDAISGVDKQIDRDASQRQKHLRPHKY